MRKSPAILVAASTPWDTEWFRWRTDVNLVVVYYSDAEATVANKLPASAGGKRDMTLELITSIAPVAGESPAYADPEMVFVVTGTATMEVDGSTAALQQEPGGMRRLIIVAAPLGSPDEAAGSLSYRIFADVEVV